MTASNTLRPQINRFLVQVFVGIVFALGLSIFLNFLIEGKRKRDLAHAQTLIVNNDIVIGNFRDAMQSLQFSTLSDFEYISLRSSNGEILFCIPANSCSELEENILTTEIQNEINFGDSETNRFLLNFAYTPLENLKNGALIWLLLILISTPLLFLAYRRMIASAQRQLEFEKKESAAQVALRVSHDIRSPLQALKVANKSLSEEPQESSQLIEKAIQRISQIAEDVLAESKTLTTQKKDKDLESKVEISSLLSGVIRWKQKELGTLKIELQTSSASRCWIIAEKSELERILSNLLNNAQEAGATIVCLKLQSSQGSSHVDLQIVDNGKGFPEGLAEKILLTPQSRDKRKGHGIGLQSTKDLLAQWGGALRIQSSEGMGSEITLMLLKA